MIEALGYFATAVVVGSFAIQNVKWLRVANTMGSLLWIVYGLSLIHI